MKPLFYRPITRARNCARRDSVNVAYSGEMMSGKQVRKHELIVGAANVKSQACFFTRYFWAQFTLARIRWLAILRQAGNSLKLLNTELFFWHRSRRPARRCMDEQRKEVAKLIWGCRCNSATTTPAAKLDGRRAVSMPLTRAALAVSWNAATCVCLD